MRYPTPVSRLGPYREGPVLHDNIGHIGRGCTFADRIGRIIRRHTHVPQPTAL
jgi:hypothetical protein